MSEKETTGHDARAGAVAASTESADCVKLEVCPRCECSLVQPTDWTHIGRERWKVELHCPGCNWRGSGVHEQDTVDRYDDFLDAAMQQVLDDLQLLTKANMENGAQRFLSALDAGLILPEDF